MEVDHVSDIEFVYTPKYSDGIDGSPRTLKAAKTVCVMAFNKKANKFLAYLSRFCHGFCFLMILKDEIQSLVRSAKSSKAPSPKGFSLHSLSIIKCLVLIIRFF